MATKLIVTNGSVLVRKYGQAGVEAIAREVAALVAADQARGLTTRLVLLDDPNYMRPFGPHVTNPADPAQNKNAIDTIFARERFDYLMILGSSDVVPFQGLANPVFNARGGGDSDPVIPSDLPYASDARFSPHVRDFIGPTRMVGRLPDLTGVHEVEYLLNNIRRATEHKPIAPPADYFGVTAGVWTRSTQLSLDAVYGNDRALQIVPPCSCDFPAEMLRPTSHFVNCHGSPASAQFFGQDPDRPYLYPPSMDSTKLEGVSAGTVAAFECCYGMELYDPRLANGVMSISNRYLALGAAGVAGSTTIAYGPSDKSQWADVICQKFMSGVLAGESLGYSMLRTRLEYARSTMFLSAIDLKTLGQYVLIGDPSLKPFQSRDRGVAGEKGLGTALGQVAGWAIARHRHALTFLANALRSLAACVDEIATPTPPNITKLLATQLGVKETEVSAQSYTVNVPGTGPSTRGFGPAFRGFGPVGKSLPPRQHVVIYAPPAPRSPVKPLVGLLASETGGQMTVEKFYSR